MVSYFDSSFVLNMIFHESNSDENLKTWKMAKNRFSSILLKFECLNTVRKALPQCKDDDERSKLLSNFKQFMDEINFKNIESTLFDQFSLKNDFSSLRTLDMIHAITALELKKEFGDIILQTFDKRMREVCESLSLKIS